MKQSYFTKLFPVLAERSKLASICQLGYANIPLRRHLSELFSRPYGQQGAFLADPAFEAVFGWQPGELSMEQLGEDGLLEPDLVKAMDAPPEELAADYRFASNLRPYTHQVESWRLLNQEPPQSVVVSSGTGSGKTECFMVPVLNHLARQRKLEQEKLVGVRALFLYPLNALINSQRERVKAWTESFGGDIRFCLYNGNTPESLPKSGRHRSTCEVLDRSTLRKSPPPILVTNPTMLEYMLIRNVDAQILQASQGKLKWVVLDEAHTYIGSQAAEAALLIRRVLLAFGVQPEEVHFIATSATIGDPKGQAGQDLKQFLADIAGVPTGQVHLVTGARQIPLIGEKKKKPFKSLAELEDIDPEEEVSTTRYRELVGNANANAIRKLFTDQSGNPVVRLSDICCLLYPKEEQYTLDQQHEAFRWLDLLSGTRKKGKVKNGKKQEDSESFLPLRGHLFHQTLSGVWACADQNCPEKTGTHLNDARWPFGTVYLEPRKHCTCGSPAYEVARCSDCGEVYLLAEENQNEVLTHLQPLQGIDEFELDVEQSEEDTEEDNRVTETQLNTTMKIRYLIANRGLEGVGVISLDRESRQIITPGPDALDILVCEDDGEGLQCPSCGKQEGNSQQPLFRMSRIGGPFLLNTILPTLLEFAPDSGEKPVELPWRGHRLLTFNDSRQGTAKMAVSLQQGAERNTIRGLIYHFALQHGQSGNEEIIAKVIEDKARLESAYEQAPLPDIKVLIDQKEVELAKLKKSKPIPFRSLVDKLINSGSDFDNILSVYRELDPALFGALNGNRELARMLIVREFGRRPKYSNSLETMGMVSVCYPALDEIDDVPPLVGQAANFNRGEWVVFLKLCLDFFVRSGGSLQINREWRRWLGLPFRQSWLREFDAEDCGRNQRRWPKARRSGLRAVVVRLLSYVFTLDHHISEGEDRIDAILQGAWNTLIDKRILLLTGDGYILSLEQLALAPISKAWICPVTRRLLDTTLRGITPYLPERPPAENAATCQQVKIPVYDKPFGGVTSMNERIQRGREWHRQQNDIVGLHEQGVWSDLQDRVIEMSPYYRTAEHSAQQPAAILHEYEKFFKQGKVNILSCSTTMEMGIDIGGISQVAMNNVPPHPANYLQRAGRAGRRREARSLALTLCKANPLDQAVFANSRWAFDTVLAAPHVSLDSKIIVQRHIHSFLLNRFLSTKLAGGGPDQVKLSCGLFFGGEDSWAEEYCAWCAAFSPEVDLDLKAGLERLVRSSVLAGQSLAERTRQAGEQLNELMVRWRRELENLETELQDCVKIVGEKAPVVKALKFRVDRLTREYLLRELATQGYLPAYGFPAHIAAFDNLTVDQFKTFKKKQEKGEPEDNKYQRRDLASRDLATALREYAPGAEVVMNGRVFRSAGITLNWHIPATVDEVSETQAIRYAWRCDNCGASGSSITYSGACDACGASIKQQNSCEFLEPAGFAVDFYSAPHNNISTPQFVSVESPWVNGRGEWQPLANPALGHFRMTSQGHLFHHSKGVNGTGYALCLACGRAEPMTTSGELPQVFQSPHRKLRRAKEEGAFCTAGEWSIKEGISLGHTLHTDIVEFQLKNSNGSWLNDRVAARTIAVALRDSLAELLGVQAIELGCEIKQGQPEPGVVCQSILIFDNHAAGYASRADNWLAELFYKAYQKLCCPAGCDSVCPHCVLDFDQRFVADFLDRHVALRWLNKEWLDELRLPEEWLLFGTVSRPEHKNMTEAILYAVNKNSSSGVRCYTGGTIETWEIPNSPLWHLAYKLSGQNIQVEIVLPENCLDILDNLDRYRLAAMADAPHIQFFLADATQEAGKGTVLVETVGGASCSRWAGIGEQKLCFSGGWAQIEDTDDILVRCDSNTFPSSLQNPLSAEVLRPVVHEHKDRILEVWKEFNGSVSDFGMKFWQFIIEGHPTVKELLTDKSLTVKSVQYSDRYLKSPITSALFVLLIEAFKKIVGIQRWGKPNVALHTCDIKPHRGGRISSLMWDDWSENAIRRDILKALFNTRELELDVYSKGIMEVPHKRELNVEFVSGDKICIFLDQGVSYWKFRNSLNKANFDFSLSASQQVKRLNLMIKNQDNCIYESNQAAMPIAIKRL
ncbi:DEAD/DEAH box helicase [Desulfogranum marinum]|uniref:DEAD/DEAH box helicase n=1 Tax=Desulfogranum marinum TaxID=453220 RepID=UPI0029C73EC4|nr:DEAD/DEAH box helicase [Desulfogranum marinum]